MKRYHVFVDGRVQGVGFRGFAMLQAQRRHITGTVKNLSNGLVEMFVQGEEEQIDAFLEAIEKGDGRFIRVDNISVKQTQVVPNEKRFTYGW